MDLFYNLELEEKINDENGEEGDSEDILNNESDESENDNDGNLEENILYEDNIEIKKGNSIYYLKKYLYYIA